MKEIRGGFGNRRSRSLILVDDESSQGSLDIGACCLCHCALDYSDRAAFFRDDRYEDYNEDSDEEEYFFRPKDPYLPTELYDRHNALVYCDSCDRMYHQKCHFVPVTVVPRGKWVCLVCQSHSTDVGFRSPSDSETRPKELEWEHTSRNLKASAWRTELTKRLPHALQSQLATYRLAQAALETLTSTAKNRQHFTHSSQELAQTLVRLTGVRLKCREMLCSLEDIRKSDGRRWEILLQWTKECSNAEFVERVLFPFGVPETRRTDPRSPEMLLENPQSTVPDEVELISKQSTSGRAMASNPEKAPKSASNDDDSGVSLDDLRCCVCHTNEATDENDLIMCDGAGCYRAYHMKCIKPEVKASDLENEHDDWFCPICESLAKHLLLVQTADMGDDWEQRRYAGQIEEASLSPSLKSWDAVDEVFPTAEEDYAAACLLKEGKRTRATEAFLAKVLGLESTEGDFDDDEDDHFDLEVFMKERKQAKYEKDVDDVSEGSSQASLDDLSSVEQHIGKDEMNALKAEDELHDDSSVESTDGNRRRSRRLRKAQETSSDESDPGKLDESNIVSGKRGRKEVDYQKLNETMFGNAKDASDVDDTEDYRYKSRRSDNSDDSDDSDSDDDSDNSEDSDEDKEDPTNSDSEQLEVEEERSGSPHSTLREVISHKRPLSPKASSASKSLRVTSPRIVGPPL